MTRRSLLARLAVALAVGALVGVFGVNPALSAQRKRQRREVRPAHKLPREHRHRTASRCKDAQGKWLRGCS